MEIIWIDECESTNSSLARVGAAHATALCARTQTAGRGQRGNSWESEPYKNLTFSIMLKPYWVSASQQFEISMAVSIAIVRVLESQLGNDYDIAIKWPNDIYAGDKKLCGILIENVLVGNKLAQSIVGVGINVNQTEFVSPAPNPVSMAMLCGKKFELEALANGFVENIIATVDKLAAEKGRQEIFEEYFSRLWRCDGYYPYLDVEKAEKIMATIETIAPTGHLTLRLDNNTLRTYAFKQVQAIL